ncbi:hypothetical protein Mmc1_3294 [Magnetococcus marinus MC-1]|uniref:Transposase n=1 Tax=Magnetococcus marinus (strain ATCC BAA-1437 / JCM 17883 / MC-1) TaxID=156889 RepID=A0L4F3_MAGMM|nr:hypothetical protein [Magnetococcus marinus]ABK42846.1 hypothetical protein Mmc1_0319 [Magnetococcus marinus MC-1]ABK42851.1 hypothetical protein Mmc1_0324 [Magnetococcus marinus MC-1]ABK43001.1 hypothetical protein Mmc1_0476 [Magnetococcus marinus MC-1]ABK43181.1 hypothetical protein Mmc1_0660 [Magnetococcus marinus MC-1]ABK43200.1 hypothetical protein Mmc1_0679 [Magnetococcus marinus MC-1]
MEDKSIEASVLSEKQRYWLDHLRSCRSEVGTIKEYAEVHKLSLPSLYFWKRKLTQMGFLEESGSGKRRFQRLELSSKSSAGVCRIQFPNGMTVEWSGNGGESLLSVLRSVAAL